MKIASSAFGLLAMTLCLLFVGGPAVVAEQPPSFAEANAKYEAGDFKAAAGSYEAILGSGKASPELYYNLGNAYFRLGQKGKALLAYERALRILPRDKDIQWNVTILKSVLTDRLEAPGENLLVFWLRQVVALFTVDELAAATTALLLLFFGMVLLTFLLPALRLLPQFIQALTIPVLVAVAILFVFKWWDVKDPKVVILEREVLARYGPSQRETKSFLAHEGAEAKILDEAKEWFYVVLPNRSTGWIPKKTCEVI